MTGNTILSNTDVVVCVSIAIGFSMRPAVNAIRYMLHALVAHTAARSSKNSFFSNVHTKHETTAHGWWW